MLTHQSGIFPHISSQRITLGINIEKKSYCEKWRSWNKIARLQKPDTMRVKSYNEIAPLLFLCDTSYNIIKLQFRN